MYELRQLEAHIEERHTARKMKRKKKKNVNKQAQAVAKPYLTAENPISMLERREGKKKLPANRQ